MRIRDKDEEAWRRLVHLYGPLVDRWCGHRGVRGQDADDVRQEVFQAVATGLDGFRRDRPGDTFRGWLRGITRFKLLDHFRRRQAHPEAQGGTDAHLRLQQQVADEDLPDDTADDLGGLYRRALELVRGEFEPQTWDAFWRTAVEGQSPTDIATQLGVTPAAIRKAKSRVLLRLRQEIGDLIA
ncbi:transcriptional control [Fimbriiglobus ruber]|uniref:Transcriptional control n=1 Tax=Fimbriiglobus ruber TaxID=1908690 RepID=A0A225DUQ1_9BACT|nr:transcriptional control [Fimbriiglobus ruber]